MTAEDKRAWAETLPLEELWSEIRKLTGLNDLKFTHKLYERDNHVIIDFESQDLVDKIGFLKLMFREIKITRFNSEVIVKNNTDDEDTEEQLMYWGSVDFSYKHPGGGSNGCVFLYFNYTNKNGWIFDENC